MYELHTHAPIIVALDYPSDVEALKLAVRLPGGSLVKVGKALHTAAPGIVRTLIEACGLRVFLDLKFHDIPHTVAEACRVAATQGVSIMSVHACGGRRMLAAAVEAVASFDPRPLLIGVTILTSMEQDDLREVGVCREVFEQVLALAELAQECGMDGVVCSPKELAPLRERFGPDFLLVTPGIRPLGAEAHDQRRTATPRGAILAGADLLVVGRPITSANHPLRSYRSIAREAQEALCQREAYSLYA